MSIIFDLDQTLVDSKIAKEAREQRNWSLAYTYISQINSYPGIKELLRLLYIKKIPMAIVTSSPRPYCERIVEYNKLPIELIICYHDTSLHKPHPQPIIEALKRLKCTPKNSISIGDEVKDIIASKNAKVKSVAAFWDSFDKAEISKVNPDFICKSVEELKKLLMNIYDL